VKLFLKISNLCDNDTSTLRIDRRTTCRSNTALCVSWRGKYDTIRYDTNEEFNVDSKAE